MKHAGLPFRLARAPAMRIRFMYYKELRSAPACPCEKKKRLPLDATEGAHARYAHVSTLFHRDAVCGRDGDGRWSASVTPCQP